ncbi:MULTISPECIES: DEAD/DEAH box helicase [unclassified Shinella]|uniref:DEAD/DEAH box helicase n=1 Tax=unclassified Shinella TaxID=2643062 RepID=UPI00225DCC35|nr:MULTISPECIES: DEAD/DEAH box helicase [unclassified Shinella]MCO5138689.1 DEAD/DEAH box helicase [Shinella sp.]MDC7255527.1 DEAD/DEAH box helicase [Shinella sp. YE25]CAI0338324.1 DEAD/DEAH box helicase [Rhizobiaceae bacterium]CAK7256771.1 ATP-dependent RNA helicase DeaD [Shinella sp. WSC3-e]
MTSFEGLAPAMAKALEKRGYTTLTPVQVAVSDPKIGDADALVSAQTGSGKTVAFGLALAPTLLQGEERFARAGNPLALVIAPTRELAMQVKRELEWLYEMTGAVIASCVGGMDVRNERRALERGAHIIVGTPGRLRDHITRGNLDLSAIRAVVLDEADEMLDLGFREDLEFILEAAPEDRRTLMFSATVPKEIAALAKNYQREALRISTAAEREQHVDIDYRALLVVPADRENAIINVLRYYDAQNAIVFCSTRAAVNHLTARFNNRGFSVVALSGELSQNERTHALQAMRDGRARVCIATDVAARGIDLPNLELVVHADLPTNPETLLHRSGRTGRAGRKGVSALIVPLSARRKAERLLQAANLKANWATPPSAEDILRRDDERLLADPMLTDAIGEDEVETIDALAARFDARQLAAAVARFFKAGRSAPEDLVEVSLEQRKPRERGNDFIPAETKRPREGFGSSVWISVSVGRKQRAEPRWLIPMLCRNGSITKNEIGAIKMQPEETYIELSADAADGFLGHLGPNSMLERGIRVTVLEGQPDLTPQPYTRTPGEKTQRYDRPERRADWKPKGDFDKKPRFEKKRDFDKPEGAAAKPHWKDREDGGKKPAKPFAGTKPFKGKRDEKFARPEGAARKPKGKKPDRF